MSAPAPSVPAAGTGTRVLHFRDVAKAFPDGTVALEGVDLDVHRGEFVTVVGPSGCGKSTLLRIASGLSPATSGTAEMDAARIGYVFQDATLLPWRSVLKNVQLLAELHGMSKTATNQASRDAIELVGLAGHEKKLPRALSGGMRMRASLARSLTLDPDLFLFDEPFGALDEFTREAMNLELLKIHARTGKTAVLVTHNMTEAVFMSDRIAVMTSRPGRLLGIIEVPFPRPRDPGIMRTTEFADLVFEVRKMLGLP